MSPVDEAWWMLLMEPRRDAWRERANDEGLRHSQRVYASARARALSRPYSTRLAGCARAGVVVKCGCPRKRDVRWFTCRSHLLCKHCRKQRSKRLRAKLHAALEAQLEVAPRGYHLVMMTIGVRHTGDVGDDRRELMASWERFRKRYHKRWGAFVFIGAHELTKGDDGLGHPHAHVLCVWPKSCAGTGDEGDWAEVREMWLASSPTSRHVHFAAMRDAKNAVRYVSKYVTKGVETDDFTPRFRAEALAGTYNTRWLFTSRGVWVPFQPCCKYCGRPVIRAAYRWHGLSTYKRPDNTPDWTEPIWQQQALSLHDPNHYAR